MEFAYGHRYAFVDDTIISVRATTRLDLNPYSPRGGDTVYELLIDGAPADSHRHEEWPKGGSLCATIDRKGRKVLVRVDVSLGIFGPRYKLLIDGVPTPLKKSSAKKIRELWHGKLFR
jgi:hypothetical protein